MTSLVILEGKLDEIVVSRILDCDPRLRGRFQTAVAGGRSSAISLARSYLVTGDQRLALVLDADTTDLEKVAAEQALVADLLEGMAVPERFIVLMVVPEVEALLFFERGFAETVFAHKFSDSEWAAAQQSPKLELGRLIHERPTRTMNLSRMERLLDKVDMRPLAATEFATQLREFLLHEPLHAAKVGK
jgi:hypothetical protein